MRIDTAATHWSRSLGAWIVRDVLLLALFVSVWQALRSWHANEATAFRATALSVSAFLFAYAACYVAHEWGHEIGARVMRADPPRGSIRGFVQPLFDPRAHSRAQFLGLAFGGQLAYVATAVFIVAAFQPELAHRAASLGAVAFVTQSLSVDFATLGPVLRGGDVATASRVGTRPSVILRRTAVAWTALAAVLVGVHAFGGGLP